MTFTGTKVRLTGWLFSGFSFLTFVNVVVFFPFSWYLGLNLTATTFLISWKVACQLHQSIPLGLWDAFHHIPHDFSVFRFLRKLIFSYRVFAFPVPILLSIHLSQWEERLPGRLGQNSCQVAQPSCCPWFPVFHLCSLVA